MPRPIVRSGTGERLSASSRPSVSTQTTGLRAGWPARSSSTCEPSSEPSPRGATSVTPPSATRPKAVSEWCDTPRCRGRASASEMRSAPTGDTAEHGDGVARLTGGHPGEAPRRPGAQVARALRDDRQVRAEHVPGRQQAGVHGHRLEVAPEGLPHGDHAGQRLVQRVDRAGEAGGQRPAVGHDVGDLEVGVGGQRTDQHRRQRRVQVGHDHRHAVQRVGLGERRVVLGVLLVDALHGDLHRRVAGLHQVPGAGRVGGQPVGDGDDERVAAGAQVLRPRGGVQQHGRRRPAGRRRGRGRPARARRRPRAPRP